jgi:Tfp pilus assembly protein PilV
MCRRPRPEPAAPLLATARLDETSGFGLVEALVALAVVAMAAIALFDLIGGAARRDAQARARWEDLVSARAALRQELAGEGKPADWHRIVGPDRRPWWARTSVSPGSARLRRVEVAAGPGAPALLATLTLATRGP